jgi:hypothetical protein
MGRPTGEKNDYRGWSYWVVVIPTPDNRWTFAVHFERGNDPLRTRHAHGTYVTMQEADARGDAFAREWIDQWGEIF